LHLQRRALVIADNRLALNAGWDEEMLRVELAALQEVDFNLDLTGFAEQELARLLTEQQALVGLTLVFDCTMAGNGRKWHTSEIFLACWPSATLGWDNPTNPTRMTVGLT
jgi:hypothetical protein